MITYTYTVLTKKLTSDSTIPAVQADNLTVKVILDFTGTGFETGSKHATFKMADGTSEPVDFGTETIVSKTLESKHLKRVGAFDTTTIAPYVLLDGGAVKGFEPFDIKVGRTETGSLNNASTQEYIQNYIDGKVATAEGKVDEAIALVAPAIADANQAISEAVALVPPAISDMESVIANKLTIKSATAESISSELPPELAITIEEDGLSAHLKVPAGHSPTKEELGLGNVDNTADLDKPISTAMLSALSGKSPTNHTHSDLTNLVAFDTRNRHYSIPTLTPPTDLISVPVISDTFNNITGVKTKNVGQVNLTNTDFAGIISGTNRDVIYTIVIAGAKVGTGGILGQTSLKDKNGVAIPEGTNEDLTANIGTHNMPSTGRIWISVPKGTYASITAARTALGTMELKYQLATPVVTTYATEYVLDFLTLNNFKLTTAVVASTALTFSNVPTESNSILSATIYVDYAVGATLTYPAFVSWQNGLTPNFTVGKKYILLFTSYDSGVTWLGSMIGEW